MVQLTIAKDLAGIGGAAATRDDPAVEAIILCGIAVIDASSYRCWWTGRRCCWRRRRCSITARTAAIDVKHVVHIGETNAPRGHRVRVAAIWRAALSVP